MKILHFVPCLGGCSSGPLYVARTRDLNSTLGGLSILLENLSKLHAVVKNDESKLPQKEVVVELLAISVTSPQMKHGVELYTSSAPHFVLHNSSHSLVHQDCAGTSSSVHSCERQNSHADIFVPSEEHVQESGLCIFQVFWDSFFQSTQRSRPEERWCSPARRALQAKVTRHLLLHRRQHS